MDEDLAKIMIFLMLMLCIVLGIGIPICVATINLNNNILECVKANETTQDCYCAFNDCK